MPRYRRNHIFNPITNIWYTEEGYAVTTLYLAPLDEKVRYHHLYNHFSTFGAVKNVKIYNKPTHLYAYATFTEAQSATKALANQFHRIAGEQIRVAIADSKHQDKPLELEASDVTTHILHLNDECIFEILSLIDITDLCAVARSCTRFKDTADRIFTRNYEVCKLRFMVENFPQARRILVTFGSLITELWIGGSLRNESFFIDEQWQFILDCAVTCCDDRLNTLSIMCMAMPDALASKLKPFFNRLRKLRLTCCKINRVNKDIFADCSSLIDLCVIGPLVDESCILENIFPKLETFTFIAALTVNDRNWEIFTSRHNLKRLAINTFYSFSLLANFKQLDELVYLSVDDFRCEEAINGVLHLQHLEKLKLCSRSNFTKFIPKLDALKSLKCLELNSTAADSEFVNAVLQLKRIEVLRLRDVSGLKNLHLLGRMNQLTELLIYSTENVDLDIVCLIKSLKSLKTLHLNSETFEMNEKIYLKILNIILGRDERSQQMLEITCYSPDDGIDTTTNQPIFDLQCVRINSHIVKLRRLQKYELLVDVFHCKL